jgi:hypothetical protein
MRFSTTRPGRPLPLRMIPGTHFCYRQIWLLSIMRLVGLGKLKIQMIPSELTRDIPACSKLPEPSTLHLLLRTGQFPRVRLLGYALTYSWILLSNLFQLMWLMHITDSSTESKLLSTFMWHYRYEVLKKWPVCWSAGPSTTSYLFILIMYVTWIIIFNAIASNWYTRMIIRWYLVAQGEAKHLEPTTYVAAAFLLR